MRRRMGGRAIATMAGACTALLVSGCTAQVSGMPPDSRTAPQAPVTQAPEAPPAHPARAFDGLDARVKQAAAQAAESGAELTAAILDRDTGGLVAVGAGTPFPIASVVKLFIADDVLLRESQGEIELSAADRDSLGVMLRSSDDSAAQVFWDRSGGNAVIARTVARYGLPGTSAPSNGKWDLTLSTAGDLVRYYDMLLGGRGGLPPAQAEFILDNLARSTPTGTDGYPQRFGIPDGLRGEPVAVKQGWFCCWNGGNQLHVSTGVVGADRRYVVALSSLDPAGEAAARQNMTRAVETMFPGGAI